MSPFCVCMCLSVIGIPPIDTPYSLFWLIDFWPGKHPKKNSISTSSHILLYDRFLYATIEPPYILYLIPNKHVNHFFWLRLNILCAHSLSMNIPSPYPTPYTMTTDHQRQRQPHGYHYTIITRNMTVITTNNDNDNHNQYPPPYIGLCPKIPEHFFRSPSIAK